MSSVAFAQTPAPSAPLTLDAAIEMALAQNLAIASARARRLVNQAGVDVAGERLNPEGRVEFERETPKQSYSVALPIEMGGKRARRIALAEATVHAGEAELAQTIFQIRNEVRRAYFDRAVAEARLTLIDELRILAQRARDAAAQRLAAGDAPRLEVVQADLVLAQADNEATATRGIADGARIRLNALLALPLNSPTPLATPLDVSVVATDAALARAQQANAELALLNSRLEEQRARIALARALQTPDLTPEFTVTRGSEPEFTTGWRAAVAVGLPLFTRHRAGVRLEETALSQLTLERDAVVARITGEVTAAAALAEAQRMTFVRYRDQIIPQALEVERMAQDSYTLGQTGIAALLQALQATRDVRLRSLQAVSDFQAALTDLERATGAPLP
jgi:cobalt-zinc-cadmium efflux system outer membrane protein